MCRVKETAGAFKAVMCAVGQPGVACCLPRRGEKVLETLQYAARAVEVHPEPTFISLSKSEKTLFKSLNIITGIFVVGRHIRTTILSYVENKGNLPSLI